MGKSGKIIWRTDQKDKSGLVMRIALPLAASVFLVALALSFSYLIDYLLFGESLVYSSLLGTGPRAKVCEELMWLGIGIGVVAVVARRLMDARQHQPLFESRPLSQSPDPRLSRRLQFGS